MPTTTRGELIGPTGKRKNCETWADYEPSGKSEFANLCNGGWCEGDFWEPCSSRLDCRKATYLGRSHRTSDNSVRRHLPVQYSGNRVTMEPRSTQPTRPRLDQVKVYSPEEEYPYLNTARIEHQSGGGGQMSPTFLPAEEEGLLERLAKNVGQGMINAAFWHGYDMSRTVDFFPRRRRRREQQEDED